MKPVIARVMILVGLISPVPGIVGAQNLDVRLFRTINNAHSPFSDDFFALQSNSVKPLTIGVTSGFLLTGLLRKDRATEHTGVLLAATAVVNYGVTHALKAGFNRKRPYEALANVHTPEGFEGTRSFPSGHTSTAFATATMLSLQYPKWYVWVPAYTWAGLVGYSRMALGVHYPSDVLVGALVGAGSAILVFQLRKTILKGSDSLFH